MDDRPSEVFSRQHGVAADHQIHATGVSWEQQRTMLRRGQWLRYANGVLALAGAPSSWEQEAMAAVLGAGRAALLSDTAAARLHRLDGFGSASAIEVIVPRQQRNRCPESVDVRWSRRLSKADRHVVDAIPVAILPVTLIHLAASGHNVEKAIDSALRSGFSPKWLSEVFERWAHTPGVPMVERLLAERQGQRLPRSWFQRLAKGLFEAEGVSLVDEWPVRDEKGRLVAELDLAHVDLKVGVECQSFAWHGVPADRARDAARSRRLRQLGWVIVEVWWADLDRIDAVLADLRLVLHKAAALERHAGVADTATSA